MSGKLSLALLFGRKSAKVAKGEAVATQKQSSQVSPACVGTEVIAGSERNPYIIQASSTNIAALPVDDARVTATVGSPCLPGSDEKIDGSNGSSACITDHGVRGAEWEDRSSQDTADASVAVGGIHGHVLDVIESDEEVDRDDENESEFGQGCSLLLHDLSVKSKENVEHEQELFHSEQVNDYEEKTDVYSPEGFHHMADSSSNVGTSEGGAEAKEALSDVGCEQKEMDIDWEHSQSAQSEPMQVMRWHWDGTLSEEGKQVDTIQTEDSEPGEGTDVKSTAIVVAKEPSPSVLPGPSRLRWMKEVHVHMPLQIHVPQNWQQRLMKASAGGPMGVGRQKGGADCSVVASAVVEDKRGEQEAVMKVTIAVEMPTDATMARVQEWVNNLCGEAKYLAEHAWGPQPVLEGFEAAPQEVAACWSDDEFSLKDEMVNFKHSPTRGKVGGEGQGGVQSDINGAEELAAKCVGVLERGAVTAAFPGWGLRIVPALAGFHHLKRLNLSQNSIVRIASGALPSSLHLLDLSHNNITAIEGLKDLCRLRVLNLSHNRLTRIGHGLAGCVKLREVYLSDNKISEAEGFHRLLKLTLLDLARNKLSSTKSLGQLAANYGTLQALNLAGNPVHINLSEDAFRKFILGLLPRLCFLNQTPLRSGAVTRDMSADSLARAALASGGHHSALRSTGKGRSGGGGNRTKTGVPSTGAQLSGHRTSHGGGRAGGGVKASQAGKDTKRGRTVTVSERLHKDLPH